METGARTGQVGKVAMSAAGCLLIAAVATALYVHLSSRDDDVHLLTWNDPAVVMRGKQLYAAHCAGCHGANGEGRGLVNEKPDVLPAPAHDASGHTWQHPDFALIQLTKTGESTLACRTLNENGMPKFERALSDRQIVDILSYIKSTWPADIRAEQDKVNQLYKSHNAAMRDLLDLLDS
jgi:mono/diheme cytochrome c family protein